MRFDQANVNRIPQGPSTVPDVTRELDRAGEGARQLRETISELRGRLQAVLVPQPPSVVSNEQAGAQYAAAKDREVRAAAAGPPKAPLVDGLVAIVTVQDQALHDLRALLNELAI